MHTRPTTTTFRSISPNEACRVDVDSNSGENIFRLLRSSKKPTASSENLTASITSTNATTQIHDLELYFRAKASKMEYRSKSPMSRKQIRIACGRESLSCM